MENKSKEQLHELQHLCLDIGRAYVLLSSLQIHSADLYDTMGDYIRWLKLREDQSKHNAEPNKLDHLKEWAERSREIGNKKHTYQQRVVAFVNKAIKHQPHADYILTLLFGEQ